MDQAKVLHDSLHQYVHRQGDVYVATDLPVDPGDGGPPMVLVQTFQASATPFIEKTVFSADDVERLKIDGATAYWISGSHGFAFEGPNGVAYEERRVADRVLLVERGGRLYRVEGAISRDRAVEIYRSIE